MLSKSAIIAWVTVCAVVLVVGGNYWYYAKGLVADVPQSGMSAVHYIPQPLNGPPRADENLREAGIPAKVPKGPPTETYIAHQQVDAVFTKAFDSVEGSAKKDSLSVTGTLLATKKFAPLVSGWKRLSTVLRRRLREENVSTVGYEPEDSPAFLTNLPMPLIFKDALNKEALGCGQACLCDPKKRPVVDMALVIPMVFATNRFKATWSLMESLRHLTVWPKEIVFTIGGVNSSKNDSWITFVHLMKRYISLFPPQTHVSVYTAETKTYPGENRWFGFNQTSASIVALFDNDDYLHPQFFDILWRVFKQRPELEFALMKYEGKTVEPDDPTDKVIEPIVEFLKKRRYTEEEIKRAASYPDKSYEDLWKMIPTFGKEWWLGNTDAEPNWDVNDAKGEKQVWWDGGCHNGWSAFRRHVMELIPPPAKKFGGEDAIWNYRIARAKMHYRCLDLVLGRVRYLKYRQILMQYEG